MQAFLGLLTTVLFVALIITYLKPRLLFRRDISRGKASGLVFCALLLTAAAASMLDPVQPKRQTAPVIAGVAPQATAKTPPSAEIAITITALQLLQDYEADEQAADNAYDGKLLTVTGIIHTISEDILGDPYITIGQGPALSSVQCTFKKDAADKLATLQKGQTVSVTGRCEGKMLNVFLKNCRL